MPSGRLILTALANQTKLSSDGIKYQMSFKDLSQSGPLWPQATVHLGRNSLSSITDLILPSVQSSLIGPVKIMWPLAHLLFGS